MYYIFYYLVYLCIPGTYRHVKCIFIFMVVVKLQEVPPFGWSWNTNTTSFYLDSRQPEDKDHLFILAAQEDSIQTLIWRNQKYHSMSTALYHGIWVPLSPLVYFKKATWKCGICNEQINQINNNWINGNYLKLNAHLFMLIVITILQTFRSNRWCTV